jgi:hypothetical protein
MKFLLKIILAIMLILFASCGVLVAVALIASGKIILAIIVLLLTVLVVLQTIE